MRYTTTLLPLAALTHAIVLPDTSMTREILSATNTAPQTFLDRIKQSTDIQSLWTGVEESFKTSQVLATNALDRALAAASDASTQAQKNVFECTHSLSKFDVGSWLSEYVPEIDLTEEPHHPHHPPPHKKHPHHGHHKPNKTIYQTISSSKYTTKLAALVDEFPDIVEILNGTAAGNITLFAPTDKAFEKLPEGHKPDKALLRKVLAYHLSPEFFPAGRVLVSHTIPTALGEDTLGGEHQRLRVGLGLLKGLNLNFYAKIVAINIFATNGVIHGIDSLLLPPPPALKILSFFPGEFSTLQLGLYKTGLYAAIEKANVTGGTLFAPSNFAFQKLGPRINAFLFSAHGEKYLKALLEYHVVANHTLYSDAYYGPGSSKDEVEHKDIPKGYFHVDLPTLLDEKSLSVDVARYGALIDIKINGFSSVATQDGVARDGVIHTVSSVLIPPKTPGGSSEMAFDDVEELMERLVGVEGRTDL